MNITKQKNTHRDREQTSGYQWGEGRGRGTIGVGDSEIQTINIYKINKQQRYIYSTAKYSHI